MRRVSTDVRITIRRTFSVSSSTTSTWFDEYHVDGLRFDSAVNFSSGGLHAIVQALLARYPNKFIYAEDNDPGYIFQQIGFRALWEMNSRLRLLAPSHTTTFLRFKR